jgi:hypothetical protein
MQFKKITSRHTLIVSPDISSYPVASVISLSKGMPQAPHRLRGKWIRIKAMKIVQG